jgi:hypothetical protein
MTMNVAGEVGMLIVVSFVDTVAFVAASSS